MTIRSICLGAATLLLLAGAAAASDIEIRGLHIMAPWRGEADLAERFIRDALPREGVNTLVMEFDHQFPYRSHPELAAPEAMTTDEVARVVAACRAAGVRLIPEFNCLGHQSWARHTGLLLTKYPQFDETPWVPADNHGIYCRSWCPLATGLHEVVFALLDELADACGADAVHCGMDEVFLLADSKCPRCAGRDTASLFANEVGALHDHLAAKGRTMWMWGDRLLDGVATDIGDWEAATNGTYRSLDRIPRDIVICDWHYEKAYPTASAFARAGLRVLSCPWRRPEVALAQLKGMRALRDDGDAAGRGLGMLQTTWTSFRSFARAYLGEDPPPSDAAAASAACFRALAGAWRMDAVPSGSVHEK